MDKSTSNSYGGLGFDSKDLHDAQVTGMPVPGSYTLFWLPEAHTHIHSKHLTYIK